MTKLRLGISPCPNDTFALHHLIESGRYEVLLDDIEALNARAERGDLDLCKISVAAYPALREKWALLRSGGAAGYGVGPILVALRKGGPGARVAIPGVRTTAALLLKLLGDFETVPMRFDAIEEAVLDGTVDSGVLIHEGRFTYERKGLHKLADLGELWEARMKAPLPLGAIAIRRALGRDTAARAEDEIRASVAHARAHPEESAAYVAEHAREMDPEVIGKHIALYVNDYTMDLDERAIEAMLSLFSAGALPVFATAAAPPASGR